MARTKNYENLSNAVVNQAAKDYRKALIEQKKWNDKVEELERFFTGEDIRMYTTLDGETLMNGLKQQVIDHNYSLASIKRILAKESALEEEEAI